MKEEEPKKATELFYKIIFDRINKKYTVHIVENNKPCMIPGEDSIILNHNEFEKFCKNKLKFM